MPSPLFPALLLVMPSKGTGTLVRLLLPVGSHAAGAENSRNTGPLTEQIDGASVSHQRMIKLEGADVICRNVSCGQGFGYLSHDAALVCRSKSERGQTLVSQKYI